jgi:hypothetical protein
MKRLFLVITVSLCLHAIPRKRLLEDAPGGLEKKRSRTEEIHRAGLFEEDIQRIRPYIEEYTVLKSLRMRDQQINEKLEQWSQNQEFSRPYA